MWVELAYMNVCNLFYFSPDPEGVHLLWIFFLNNFLPYSALFCAMEFHVIS